MSRAESLPITTVTGNRQLVVDALASHLGRGSLSLVLGAGVSMGMGLPNWTVLVTRCIDRSGLATGKPDDNTSTDQLMRMMDKVERHINDNTKYMDCVRSALYENMKSDGELLLHPLISALAAMIVKGSRGNINEILSYNFDDVIERYLDLYGLVPQVITDLPQLRRNSDVAVYHPHGFLPYNIETRSRSREIVFSKESFDKFVGSSQKEERLLIRDMILRKCVLFLGMTYNNSPLSVTLANLKYDLNLARSRGSIGYWIVGANDSPDTEQELESYGIVPLRLEHHEYPGLLLDVCRKAAKAMPHYS